MVPDDSETSTSKEQILAQIDTAMGGHIAEKLFIGEKKISSGCGGDLQGATQMAYQAVRHYGMFGESTGFIAAGPDDTSDNYKAAIDMEVKRIVAGLSA